MYSFDEILPILKTICATSTDVGGLKLVVIKYAFEPYKPKICILFQELLSKERSERLSWLGNSVDYVTLSLVIIDTAQIIGLYRPRKTKRMSFGHCSYD
jgi:hypothetical protein